MTVGLNLNFLNLGYHTYVFCSSQSVSFGYFFRSCKTPTHFLGTNVKVNMR